MNKPLERNFVIVNQAANYLTIGFCNAFNKKFGSVSLVTGSIHVQGEELDDDIDVSYINKWVERPSWKKTIVLLNCVCQNLVAAIDPLSKPRCFIYFHSPYGLLA